ncbi:hypothetical protein Tco_1332742, partial [Tanacetum coccineum]
ECLKFNNHNFSSDSQKEFRKRYSKIRIKEIERPKGLDFKEFGTLHEGIALQNLNQFCHVSYEQDDRRFTSQAWNKLFRIKEQIVREYVMEFLSSFTFRDHIEELDIVDTMVFQVGEEMRSMTMRQFIQALDVYRHQEMNNNLFEGFYDSCYRSRPIKYDPTLYVLNITTHASYDTQHPPSYTLIRSPIRRLAHRLLTLSIAGRHSGKEKEKGSKRKSPIVGAHLIGKIAHYYGLMTVKALTNVTLGHETSSISVSKLVDLGICKYNGLGIGKLVAEIPEVAGDDDVGTEQAEIGGFGRHPNMSTANKLSITPRVLGQ